MWHSELPDVVSDDTTLHELLLSAADHAGETPALVDGPSGTTVTFATLAERARRVAGWLMARGYRPGDVLALWAPNVPPWAGVALGAMAAGLTVTPVSPAASEREATRQVRDANATILVTAEPSAATALSLRTTTAIKDVVAMPDADGAISIYELVAAPPLDVPPTVRPDTVALIPYSSGTTGMPKGVMLSHANLVTATRQIAARVRPDHHDTMLAVAPFTHILGFTAMLTVPLSAGARVVTLPQFDPAAAVQLIDQHSVTTVIGAPPMMPALLRQDADLSSLRFVAAGGAPLRSDMHRALARRLPKAVVGQGWGLTELTGVAAVPDRDEGTVTGTVGRPVPNTSIRVIDVDSGADLDTGDAGELWVRGPQTMLGYLHQPQATAEMITSAGWLRTGDLGYVDHDGNVVIVDRLKELLKVNGLQVAPAELEELLQSHPAVGDAAVLGRPDDRRGEVPVALVVAASPVDTAELSAWVDAQVAPHKRLADIHLVESVPRAPSGKLLRRQLRAQDSPAQRATGLAG